MGGAERKYVGDAFDTNWVAPLGPAVDGFEKDLEEYLGEDVKVAALGSGTAALHLALIMLGVRKDDIVICQSMTFAASANPIAYLGARPVFVDSEEETWNMSPGYMEEAIKDTIAKGKKPKAIIVVHLYGMPAKINELLAISRKYDIPLIEDAAEALGSTIDGRKCGTFGEIAILSFNGNKIITTSGGGALVSRNEEYVKKARFLSTQARDAAPHYEHSQIGYNYRMSNICAAIGRGQMEVLDERVQQRRANFVFYKENLGGSGMSFPGEPRGYYSNRWLTTAIVDTGNDGKITRETLRLALEKENIESRPLWKPMHLQPVFQKEQYFGDHFSEKLFEKGLCLPSGSNLNQQQLNRVIDVIKNIT